MIGRYIAKAERVGGRLFHTSPGVRIAALAGAVVWAAEVGDKKRGGRGGGHRTVDEVLPFSSVFVVGGLSLLDDLVL